MLGSGELISAALRLSGRHHGSAVGGLPGGDGGGGKKAARGFSGHSLAVSIEQLRAVSQRGSGHAASSVSGADSFREIVAWELGALGERLASEHERRLAAEGQGDFHDVDGAGPAPKADPRAARSERCSSAAAQDLVQVVPALPAVLLNHAGSGRSDRAVATDAEGEAAFALPWAPEHLARSGSDSDCSVIFVEPPSGHGHERPSAAPAAASFAKLPVWGRKKPAFTKARTQDVLEILQTSHRDSDDAAGRETAGPWCRCGRTVHPHRPLRVAWDLLGMVFILYESVVLPLQMIDIPANPFIQAMTWLIRGFWSVDLPLSFVTGYLRSTGEVELRRLQVVKHYLLTWFAVDVSMLVTDWAEWAVEGSRPGGAARMGKIIKSLRLIRLGRVLRITRIYKDLIPAFAQYLLMTCQSELVEILGALVRMLALLVWLNHVAACGWYAVAEGSGDGVSWLTVYHWAEKPLGQRYLVAFYWAVTLFTGSAEIFPQSFEERCYGAIMLLLAFVIAAWVVSVITTSMTRLEVAAAHDTKKLTSLQEFLFESKISRNLAMRVQKNAKYAIQEQKRSRPNIELLKLISEPLRVELHFEVRMPVLSAHPFFRCYSRTCPAVMRQVCHAAVTKLFLTSGDVLFKEGDAPPVPQMYFICTGDFSYYQSHEPDAAVASGSLAEASLAVKEAAVEELATVVGVKPGQWACEPALWTQWLHCGSLLARTDCTLLSLSAEQFQQIAAPVPQQSAADYCEGFVRLLNTRGQEDLTDLADPAMDIEAVAHAVCPPPLARRRGSGLGRGGRRTATAAEA